MQPRILGLAAMLLLAGGCASGPGMQRATLNASLTGLQEVPGPGDPDGNGTAEVRVDPAGGQVCWELYARAIDPATAAHIHRGEAGTTGPPVVPLTTPGTDGRSSGCASVDPAVAQEMAARGYAFYVNVHTQAQPAGAIRGQLRGGVTRQQRQPAGR